MLQSLWQKLGSIGIHKGIEEREQIKIRLLNKLAVITIIVAISFSMTDLLAGKGLTYIFQHFASCIFASFVLLLHSKKIFSLTRHITSFLFPLLIAYIIIARKGIYNGEATVFLTFSLLCLIQYEGQTRLRILSILWTFILGIGAFYYISVIDPSPVYHYDPLGVMIVLISQITQLSLIIGIYQNDIQQLAHQKESLFSQLKIKNTELERFAYITSHDLIEPARTVENFAKLLKSQLVQKEGQGEELKLVDIIGDSATRMSSMIADILTFSKLEKEALTIEMVDLNETVQQFSSSHSQFLQERNAKIQFSKLPSIPANRLFMSRLFQNLLQNAIKYNEAIVPTININGHTSNGTVLLSIKDNGIGIDQQYQAYIFEPFRRLHNRSKYKGTGLGLSICKKIVETHQGKIWVESKGQGSEFHISLPLRQTVSSEIDLRTKVKKVIS